MKSMYGLLMCATLLLGGWGSNAQEKKFPFPVPKEETDTTFLDSQKDKWSLRIFGQYRLQGISLVNRRNGERFRYEPVNPYAVGLGIAYKYLIVDIGLNLRTDDRDPLSRFNLVGSLYFPRSLLDFFFQDYNGFILNRTNERRNDINTRLIGFNWYHNIGEQRINLNSVFQGRSIVKRSSSSWGVGAYTSMYRLKADSSIVPGAQDALFNEYAQITSTQLFDIGFLFGYTQSVALPKNFFTILGIYPGLGFNAGDVQTETFSYDSGLLSGKLIVRAALGVSTQKRYMVISLSMDNFLVDIENDNRYRYSSGRIKLVYGIRYKSEIKPIERMLPE